MTAGLTRCCMQPTVSKPWWATGRLQAERQMELGKPDAGKPPVRFDEGREADGHWHTPLNPSLPAYSTKTVSRTSHEKHATLSLSRAPASFGLRWQASARHRFGRSAG